jgi:replication fork protection complex subunit Tof1/Swi1
MLIYASFDISPSRHRFCPSFTRPSVTKLIYCIPLSAFLSALLKDIKSERPKITEKDNLRLLFVTKWFLEFFLASRAKASSAASRLGVNAAKGGGETEKWEFGLIAEVIERGWIVWVLKRMREAVEEKVRVCPFR